MAEQVRRGRGRRPAAQVRAEVLAAAGELLLDVGMGAFTFERVATLSGASKVTLYKWWPSKGALALEASEVHLASSLPHITADYMGEHWLATFALLAMTAAGVDI